jgi:serine/threonine protein kinase
MTGRLIHHYRIVRKLGQGGMGEVYLAEDTRLGRQVAIKLLPAEAARDRHQRQRFLTEAKSASALNHANVCIIHEVGETEDERPFLVMEFVEGRTLGERLRAGQLEIDEVLEIGCQVADALDAAHLKGVVHRDIKPGNICLNARGQVKVLDFGLAKRMGLETAAGDDSTTLDQTREGQVLGTPNYMSPEQALGRAVDHRTDIFSLGVILYEMTTGRAPFAASSLGETISRIVHQQPEALARYHHAAPQELERIVRKCLSKMPDSRYQSCRELLLDLRSLRLEHTTTLAPAAASAAGSLLSQTTRSGSQTEPPSLEHIKRSDLFVSYASLDDKPIAVGEEGWISRLNRNLEIRIEQLSGLPITICPCPNPVGNAPKDPRLLQQLTSVKTLVSVISPPFARSSSCHDQLQTFCQHAEQEGRLRADSKSRVFKVVKSPIDPGDVPAPLSRVLSSLVGFDFFERDSETGRLREYDESFGELARQRFQERVYDLAYEISQVLKQLRSSPQPTTEPKQPSGKRIFLALTTSDLHPQRDQLQRELLELGHTVLPQQTLPLVARDLEDTVRHLLEESDLSIHLIGDRYGLVPEDSDLSVVALQNQLAAERSRCAGLERLVWMPRSLQPRDARQAAFIEQLTHDQAAHCGAEMIADTLENLKEVLLERLAPRRPPPSNPVGLTRPDGNAAPPRVFLICDRADEQAVEPLEDYLFAQGIEVSLPGFDAEEAEFQSVHIQNLRDCDAVLVYYGQAGKSWVEIKVRELLKAAGYRDGKPIRLQGVYVAPPHDHRKERFKTLTAEVLRQEGAALNSNALERFVTALKELRKTAHT